MNNVISSYYDDRTAGKRKDRWSEQMATMLEKQTRMYMKEFVRKNKMNMR